MRETISGMGEGKEDAEGDGEKKGDGDGDGDGKGDDKGPGTDSADGKGESGEGKGAGTKGKGPGGGGKSETTGSGNAGTGQKAGSGAGTGTGPGAGPGKGTGKSPTDAKDGAGGEKGAPGGKPGGTGTDPNAKKPSGEAGTGKEDAPTPPPGVPTGPDGTPYSPDMQLPEVMPESGTLVTDPSQVQTGTEKGDPRGEPGSDAGSAAQPGGMGGTATRPGGMGGGATDGEGTASERGAAGPPGGGEGGEKGGASGGLRGGHGWLTLPSWLAAPLNFVADKVAAVIDYVQTGLDVVGLIPGLGEIADGLNGLISLARGDYVGAGLSFAAMVPFAGWAATAGKFGRRAVKVANAAGDATRAATKYGDEVASVVKFAERNADEAAGLVSKNADEMGSFMATGADVAHGPTVTRIGGDEVSKRVAQNVAPTSGMHDVVVHGSPHDEFGAMFNVDGLPTHANQIADAIKSNPAYKGETVRLITCWGACGPAKELSSVLKVDVVAATDRVLVERVVGAIPEIENSGVWKLFSPSGASKTLPPF